MHRLIAAAFGAAFSMLAFWPGAALGGEQATPHRAGDIVGIHWACHDAASVIAIAESPRRAELGAVLTEQGKCFWLGTMIRARLMEWIAGPFAGPDRATGSVWRAIDRTGDTEFVWIGDAGGHHPAPREMAF